MACAILLIFGVRRPGADGEAPGLFRNRVDCASQETFSVWTLGLRVGFYELRPNMQAFMDLLNQLGVERFHFTREIIDLAYVNLNTYDHASSPFLFLFQPRRRLVS